MKNILLFVLCVFLGLYFGESIAQDSRSTKKINYWSVSADYGSGGVLNINPFVGGDNQSQTPIDRYRYSSIKVLWQNPGYTDCQKVYHGPYYGFGASIGDMFHPDEVGSPISYYGILGIPIFRTKKFEMYSEFQFGLAHNWVKYDSITNPYNIVIGGALTVHLNVGLRGYYQIGERLDLGAGLSFIHFSNGGMERPNRGFNIYAPSVEMKYHINRRPPIKSMKKAPRLNRSNDLLLIVGYGNHQLVEHELDSNYYAIGGISAIYFNQLSNAFRLGYDADLNYWWGLTANSNGTPGKLSIDNLTVGFIVQPEFIVDRLSITGGVGIYAKHIHYGPFKKLYQRLGVRYDFYNSLSFGVNIRSVNFMLAEFLEFNLGYRIQWMK